MVGGEHHLIAFFGDASEQLHGGGVLKPRFGESAVGGVAVSQFANHLAFGAGVRQHIHKVEHHYVEIVLIERIEAVEQAFAGGGVVYFVVGE